MGEILKRRFDRAGTDGANPHIAWFLSAMRRMLVMAFAAAVLFAGASLFRSAAFLGIALLTGMAGFAIGGLIGFLFGVPRIRSIATDAAGPPIVSNTNLEQLSDWLTKILVGVGLVQIHEVNLNLVRFRMEVDRAVAIGGVATSDGAGLAACLILIGSTIAGFLSAYLKAKTDLMRAFREPIDPPALP